MLRNYKKISKTLFKEGNYALTTIRDEDKYDILKWRNEQIDILRQDHLLTKEQQENYFKNTIDKLFEQDYPTQYIFSFFENDNLIGYGGLVHIDWENKTAEISFLTETSRNGDKEIFINDWKIYLSLVKQVADKYLNFKAIYTYAYDLRPNLYIALESSGFNETKRVKNHVVINGESKDVVIHSFLMKPLIMGFAKPEDVKLYFDWANDSEVRRFSFNQETIVYENHVKWFNSKINHLDYKFYIFRNEFSEPVGQVRINRDEKETIVGISIDSKFRGYGYGSKMLIMACQNYFLNKDNTQITAYIKIDNSASLAIFKKAGFIELETLLVNKVETKKLVLNNE